MAIECWQVQHCYIFIWNAIINKMEINQQALHDVTVFVQMIALEMQSFIKQKSINQHWHHSIWTIYSFSYKISGKLSTEFHFLANNFQCSSLIYLQCTCLQFSRSIESVFCLLCFVSLSNQYYTGGSLTFSAWEQLFLTGSHNLLNWTFIIWKPFLLMVKPGEQNHSYSQTICPVPGLNGNHAYKNCW